MGQEIHDSRFSQHDFARFSQRLTQETELLGQWFKDGHFSRRHCVAGFELETWLVDRQIQPLADNERFLTVLADPMVSPELSCFNVELNTPALALQGKALSSIHHHLQQTWEHCEQVAQSLGEHMLMIGIPANLQEKQLCLANMSKMLRYRALNEQVLRLRQGKPLLLDIEGEEHLHLSHQDVMLESAATSFQLHLQVAEPYAVRFYNASLIAAAPVVAVSANSPFAFGKDLWAETRIPLFEQAVDVGGYDGAAFGPIKRVSFGSGYARESLFELYEENLQHYPVLLAETSESEASHMDHVRLHNGTIWRWNRPLIGFDEDGTPHLRIEHRVIPAGPSLVDAIANAAFYYGLVQYLATADEAPESRLAFATVRDNFASAARYGLRAHLHWLEEGYHAPIRELILQQLLPQAEQGLIQLQLDKTEINYYLGIIRQRVDSGQNGSQWQRDFVSIHGRDWTALMQAYYRQQQQQSPVHLWEL
ncbi:MAG: glutamate--cysteine ligase [Gammaproteobacteria bacterium]|nr:glutamate--cysteine ligase [Gammaproteobacteria bacterium]